MIWEELNSIKIYFRKWISAVYVYEDGKYILKHSVSYKFKVIISFYIDFIIIKMFISLKGLDYLYKR